jgi:hypothetical protein
VLRNKKQFEQDFDKIVNFIQYIHDKDVFFNEYIHLFSNRLLNNDINFDIDQEKQFISIMKFSFKGLFLFHF